MGSPLIEKTVPDWARWNTSPPYSLGLEEEAMLLDPATGALAQRSDEILPALPPSLTERLATETHQAALELGTEPHASVAAACAQLAQTRRRLAASLAGLGLRAAAAGTHPTTTWQETEVSPAGRYQLIHSTMGELARREPTFALHVHVGVPDPEAAIRLMTRLRRHLPLLLALSGNSPFWQGRDTRLASARTPLFGAFPRTGLPRRFDGYDDWVASVGLLLRSGAFPDPTFLWWDMRPQPRFGTVEIRIMDAQITVEDTAALVALIQSVARLELEEGTDPPAPPGADEVLHENRFLAARDGMDAELMDVALEDRRPVRDLVASLVDAALPHAQDLCCATDLESVAALAADPGAARQRRIAARGGGPAAIPLALAARFG